MSFARPIWTRFLATSTVLAVARVGPLGRFRHAPGTWGSLGGVMFQLVVFHYLDPFTSLLLIAACTWLAVAFCGEAEFRLGKQDPGEVVLDELVAMPICYLGWPWIAVQIPAGMSPWLILVCGFALFRVFDILKPLGIARLQGLPGGWGVMMDDIAAAVATCLVMHAGAYVWTHWHG